MTKEDDPAYYMNEESVLVLASDFKDHLPSYKIYSFRVEPGSDKIDSDEITVNYHIEGNSSPHNLPLRFTNWKKAGKLILQGSIVLK